MAEKNEQRKKPSEDIFATKRIYGTADELLTLYKARSEKKAEVDRKQDQILKDNMKLISDSNGNLTFECWYCKEKSIGPLKNSQNH